MEFNPLTLLHDVTGLKGFNAICVLYADMRVMSSCDLIVLHVFM